MIRFFAIFFLFAIEIRGQYQQSSGCVCPPQQQQSAYGGSLYNGNTGYQYGQTGQLNSAYGYQNPSSSSQSGAYASNNGYQSGAYTGNAQYNPSSSTFNQQQQGYGSSYSQGQQYGSSNNQAYQSSQYQGGTGSQSAGSQSGNSSEPGYLRDYKGDIYTDPGRIKETQALNAPFFQSIGGEPQYQGAVDGPQQSNSQGGSSSQGSSSSRGKK